jgi:hypothetical protein
MICQGNLQACFHVLDGKQETQEEQQQLGKPVVVVVVVVVVTVRYREDVEVAAGEKLLLPLA